jgi:hypothetical protein
MNKEGESMSIPSDTSPEAEHVLTEIYRNMSIGQKWLLLGKAYRTAKTLHAAGVRWRNPAASEREIHEDWLAVTLGDVLLKAIRDTTHEPSR